ncbi:MAG: hypothetical protein INH41_00200 [Myxococcaceae bacterium]|nr:hypothetical protein [Myxococcaceae bacterium]MCA3010797.1 hypothetical protein [Myxococcaceae bacterium]
MPSKPGPHEALRSRADALDQPAEPEERALDGQAPERVRLAAAQFTGSNAPEAPTLPVTEDRRAERTRAARRATGQASLAVGVGAVALGAGPFAYVMTQTVDVTDGATGVLFGLAFLFSAVGIIQLPPLCFGLLAPGSESVSTDSHTGTTQVTLHSAARARRAGRWLAAWVVLAALCLAVMPRTA